jgi:hypothetical protein
MIMQTAAEDRGPPARFLRRWRHNQKAGGIGQPPRAGYGRRAKDSVQVTLEQRVLSIRGRRDVSLPGDLAPRYLDYERGNYERAFNLSGAADPASRQRCIAASCT